MNLPVLVYDFSPADQSHLYTQCEEQSRQLALNRHDFQTMTRNNINNSEAIKTIPQVDQGNLWIVWRTKLRESPHQLEGQVSYRAVPERLKFITGFWFCVLTSTDDGLLRIHDNYLQNSSEYKHLSKIHEQDGAVYSTIMCSYNKIMINPVRTTHLPIQISWNQNGWEILNITSECYSIVQNSYTHSMNEWMNEPTVHENFTVLLCYC